MDDFSELFRPQNPNQLIGKEQKRIAAGLLDSVAKGTIVHNLLFTGPSGTGKTTIAKMYAKAVGGEEFHMMEFNCSDDTGKDFIKEYVIDDMCNYPITGKYKIYFLDEVHGLSKPAQNSLLKDTEPLPDYVVMILSSSEPHKLIPALKSRFSPAYELQIPSRSEFIKKAEWIVKASIWGETKPEVPMSIVDEIIDGCEGNVRNFDKTLQSYLMGSYVPITVKAEDPKSLVYKIINGQPNLTEWFNAAKDLTSYQGEAVGMCHYCIAVINNPKSMGDYRDRAAKLLKVFGNGLSLTTSEKAAFHQKLIELYEELK